MISVTNIAPADLTSVEPSATLTFDVTATASLLRVLVCVEPVDSGRAPELAHDGTAFRALYEGSVRTAVAGGYRYVLRRVGGWYAAPRPLVFAVDVNGQEL